ncbi:MAG: penicillin-binding protein 2 [Pseudomonadota bacterium]
MPISTIHNKKLERNQYRSRLLTLTLIVLFFILVLLARLFYLQISEHHRYVTLSKQNQIAVIPIAPARGLIFDRNGILLAKNKPVFSLDIIPYKVKHLKKTLAALKKIVPLSRDEVAEFYKTLRQKRAFDPVPLKYNLSQTEMAEFAVNQWRFPGVMINAHLLRYYPYNGEFAHVLGYMGRIDAKELAQLSQSNYSATNYIGKTGIEKYYEKLLHGQVGYQQVEIDAAGHIVRVLKRKPPVSGANLYLTIDSKLEQVAEKALGNNRGAVVAIQPNTGQILAMVSSPTYNPNLFVSGISSKAYQALKNSPNKPLYNRAIRGLFAIGSTIKPFISLEALAEHVITPQTTIFDPGYFIYAHHIYHDWRKGGHGYVNVTKAIIVSCDTFFYRLAVHLGINNIDKVLAAFGFGQPTGVDLNDELPGVLPSPSWKMHHIGHPWYTGDTINTDVGQGFFLATPLQIANAVATLATHGIRHQPTLLMQLQYPHGIMQIQQSKAYPQINFPQADWRIVINAMQKVITSKEGTGFRFGRNTPYTVAAKTGTAQVYTATYRYQDQDLPENLRDNSLFIAFAPINHPRIAIAVIDEHSELAPVVARKVIDYYLLTEKHWSKANETH